MSLDLTYSDPRGIEEPAVTTSLGSNTVRFGRLALSQSAEVGEPALSGLEVDDPNAAWNFVGLRAITASESSAPSNNRIVYRGAIQDRSVARADSLITGTARRWSIDLVDQNWNLSKRVLVDEDANRPAETGGDRLRWLLTEAAHINFHDYGHVSYPSNTPMDANDYRDQRASDVLADVAVESGYNFWCEYNEAHQRPELFFMHPAFLEYESTLRISNDPDDYDGTTTFLPLDDARLTRSASRIASGVHLAYMGGSEYVHNDTTAAQFADVDQQAPMANVKTAARARRVANHFLSDHAEETDRIACSIHVPLAQVNDLRTGHMHFGKFRHFPGHSDWGRYRVLRRTVIQEDELWIDNLGRECYRLDLELTPAGVTATPAGPTTVMAADLSVGNAIYGYGDRTQHWGTQAGASTYTLIVGKQYRLVATMVGALDVGTGLQYSAGACNFGGRFFDVQVQPKLNVNAGAGSTAIVTAPTYLWTPGNSTAPTYGDFSGISFAYASTGGAGTVFPCGHPQYEPGNTFESDWLTFNGPAVAADLSIESNGISGFFGFYWVVHLELQERTAP